MEKVVSRGLLTAYLAILVWLVLFKFSFNIPSILDHHKRSLNVIPFAAPSIVNGGTNFGEIAYNCIFFIPFGVLLNINFKGVRFLPKLASILVFSLTAELTQFIFAIGATDITDVITNTVGGFLGLHLYCFGRAYINDEKLNRVVIAIGTLLLVVFLAMIATHFGPFRSRGIR
ncbi:MAG TPA: VanZ family protein [Thermomicrobiales bacterium]|jgi:glycopeptide antibiotics resistance protein